jgi:putative solute:sodium symporter small subunit
MRQTPHAGAPDHAAEYWRRKRRLTLQLLAIWFSSTFSAIYFARELDDLKLFGWPLPYYMAAQGLALIYLALIAIYNRRVQRMEADYHRCEKDGDHAE